MGSGAEGSLMTKYSLDPAWEHEKQRLDLQASLYDGATRARIEMFGIEEGWRCAEIGAGSGTVAVWLSNRVGSSGRVVATDLDTRFLDALELANVEVRRHDIVTETLEPESYDLVHVRFLLMHLLGAQSEVVAHMVDALKPGGWLLAEEMDIAAAGELYPPDDKLERVSLAMTRLQAQTSVDGHCGRKLPSLLESAGLVDVQAEGRMPLLKQGTEQMKVLTLFYSFHRDRLAGTGLVTAQEVDDFLEVQDSPGSGRMMPTLAVAAWGRKPAACRVSAVRTRSFGEHRASRDDRAQGAPTWVVMADPEGDEFCVLEACPRSQSCKVRRRQRTNSRGSFPTSGHVRRSWTIGSASEKEIDAAVDKAGWRRFLGTGG